MACNSSIASQQTFDICGYHFEFYSAGELLPSDFMTEHQIQNDWLVSVQHGQEYKEMLRLFQHCYETKVEVHKDQFYGKVNC